MAKANTSKSAKFSFTDFIGLSTPLSRVIIIGGILITLFLLPYSNLLALPKISLYQNLGINFYSIGETRALSLILHGQLQNAWSLNKLSFILLAVILVILSRDIYLLFKRKSAD